MSVVARSEQQQASLASERVVFTGRLASMTRPEALWLVEQRGGRCGRYVTQTTTLVVLGQDRWPLAADGRVTRNLRRAQLLQHQGADLQILSEDAFLERLGLYELRHETCRRYSLAQLGRLVGLSRDRLRAWLRAGLIQPVERLNGIPFFDFGQIAAAKTLWRLAASGVSAERLRRSLEQLRRWLPQTEDALAKLHLLEGQLLVRCEAGLAELSGQMLLDFDPPAPNQPALHLPRDLEAEFAEARRQEELGQYDQAVQLYRDWLVEHGPDPAVVFNLANSLAALGRTEAALERFRQAVELNPEYVEAWNNLGAALASAGEPMSAVEAFQAALNLDPTFSDALYNLADTLDEIGRCDEALPYWERYVESDPDSDWAAYARSRLDPRS